MKTDILPAYDKVNEIRELFSEYTKMLVENESRFSAYLEKQNYAAEVEDPTKKYAEPFGRLYVVYADGKLAGCIGLKKNDEKSCELKRLYVREEFRCKGIGKMLVEKIISDAKEIGYESILLDTFPFLESAIRMYKRLGFYEIESYNGNPMDNLIYLKLDLSEGINKL